MMQKDIDKVTSEIMKTHDCGRVQNLVSGFAFRLRENVKLQAANLIDELRQDFEVIGHIASKYRNENKDFADICDSASSAINFITAWTNDGGVPKPSVNLYLNDNGSMVAKRRNGEMHQDSCASEALRARAQRQLDEQREQCEETLYRVNQLKSCVDVLMGQPSLAEADKAINQMQRLTEKMSVEIRERFTAEKLKAFKKAEQVALEEVGSRRFYQPEPELDQEIAASLAPVVVPIQLFGNKS